MSAVMVRSDWRLENARWLRLALRRLRVRLNHACSLMDGHERRVQWPVTGDDAPRRNGNADEDQAEIDGALMELDVSLAEGRPPALRALAALAGLDAFESEILLLAAAPSLDGSFARVYAELNDDRRRDCATLHLALSLFCNEPSERLLAADSLMPSSPLRALRLIEVSEQDGQPLLLRGLGVDERVAAYLRGVNVCDERVTALVLPAPDGLASASAISASRHAASLIEGSGDEWPPAINIVSEPDAGGHEVARLACAETHLQPRLLNLNRLAALDARERATLTALLSREALLANMAIVLDATAALPGSPVADVIDELLAQVSAVLFVISRERWTGAAMTTVSVARPSRQEQASLWRAALASHANSVNGEVDVISQQFDFGPSAIAETVSRVACHSPDISGRALWAACRERSGASLGELAHHIIPRYGWDDIVVPDEARAPLRELAAQVEQRPRVYETWGFGRQLSRGRGITALFAGPSGTGKTMAAEIVAGHLDLDLFRIDLAGVVSKYIGETEKNLRRLFDAAERSGAILFFDEADALFSTRTDVRDSHDRYANLEVNYLLQRMEDYSGLAILATNRRAGLDSAFLRRLRFIIDFHFPGIDDRRRMWQRAFPPQAALDGVDFATLANLELSGGSIKSIAINAAFLAASDGAAIGMPQIMRAATREYGKLSKPISAAEFGPYYAGTRR
jgi:hypothetical protein